MRSIGDNGAARDERRGHFERVQQQRQVERHAESLRREGIGQPEAKHEHKRECASEGGQDGEIARHEAQRWARQE